MFRDLQWKNVDFDAGVIRLDVGSTKPEDRILPFKDHAELQAVLSNKESGAIMEAKVNIDGFRGPWTRLKI